MTARMQRYAHEISTLANAKPSVRKVMIKNADNEFIKALCDCSYNILKGNVPLNKSQKIKLSRYKKDLRYLCNNSVSLKDKKRKVIQKGGFFLPALAGPLLKIFGGLIPGAIGGIANLLKPK